MTQQRNLLEAFPDRIVKQLPATSKRPALDFVSWTDKIQRLIQISSDYDWQIIAITSSGDSAEPVAVHGRLSLTVDGTRRTIDGIGQGDTAKKASTDAFARACAFIGLGLHLWCQGGSKDGGYWITTALDKGVSDGE